MSKFFRVFQYVHIHPLLWVVISIGVMTAHFYDLCLLLMIIFIHEMGHAVAASFFNWRINKISLLPFGGVAEMEEHGNRPLKEEAVVVIAGPAQHIWLVGLGYVFYINGWLTDSLFHTFLQFNGMIFFFNILPIWPLDGGKLLFLLLSLKSPFPLAHKKALVFSTIGVFLFFLSVCFLMPTNLNAWIIIVFLLFSIHYEWRNRRFVFMRFLMERYYGKTKEVHKLVPIETMENESILNVLDRFQRGVKHPIIVHREGNSSVMLDENEVLHAYFKEKLVSATIGDIAYLY